MVLKMNCDPVPDDDLTANKKTTQMKSPTEAPTKYKGVFFGCVLLCRDKCSKDTNENNYIWKPCEVTAIDGETAVQLHYVGSPLKYDRWMSLQSDWKDLAPTKLLSKDQIENGTPLNPDQTTAVYDYLLTGEVADVIHSTTVNRTTTPQSQRSGKVKYSDIPRISTAESRGESELFVGKKIEVRDIFQTKENEEVREKWRLAQVVEIRGEIVRIHFSGWDVKWDEDINIVTARNRIRERRKKAPSLDASLSEALKDRNNMLRNCPHCGESLSLAPLIEVPEICPSYAGTRRNSMEGSELFGSNGGARRGSTRGVTYFEPTEEDNPTSFSQEESKDEHVVEEPPTTAAVPLSVDDRIHIALKVADRRLSSIRSARNLLDVAGDVPTGRRSSVGSLMAPMEMPTGRRSSVGSLATNGLPGRSLIGINSKTSFPPPDQFRVSYELPKLAAE